MQISPLYIYNFANTNLVQNQKLQKRNVGLTIDCVSFNGKIIPNELKNIDFSKLNEYSTGVLDVINTGTFAQILKFKPHNQIYAIKRLYPYKIKQPQGDLLPTKRQSLEQQLKNEIAVYKKLKGVNEVPQLYLYNAGDKKNPSNNYIVTGWAEGRIPTRDGAIYDAKLVLKDLPQLFKTLAEFDNRGVLHNDLWAGNILFSKKGINIIDFNDSKIFNPQKEYKISNLDDLKKRFLNIFLSDVYHRKGKKEFLQTYNECLKLEHRFLIVKKESSNSIKVKIYFDEKIKEIENSIKNSQLLENQAINTIYDSNIYWAKMMKIRENQGDFRYYLERASKLKLENPEILGGIK